MQSAQTVFRRDAQVIGLVGLAHGTSHFYHLILAPLFPWLKDAFGLSYAELGLLMTVFFAVSGTGQALAGFVVDRIGALPVLLGGIALLGLSALGLAASQSYPMLIAFAALAGLGNSVFHPADFTLLNRRVSTGRLGHAFSVHGLSGTLGWAASPVFLVGIATAFHWRVALFAASSIAFVVLAVLIAFRDLLDPREVSAAVHKSTRSTDGGGMLGFLLLPAVWMCFAFFFISSMSFGGIQSFAPSALRDIYSVPFTLATACITAYMLASAGGLIVGGFIASRTAYHDRVIAVAFSAAGLLAVLTASGALPTWLLMVVLGAIGFGSGIAGPSRDLLVRAAAPRNATGRVYGVVYSGLDIGLSISPVLFGALMDASHPGWVFVLIGVFQAGAVLTAVGVGERAASKRLSQAA
ncbi:MAG TPA: MFS transporter [Burkholderiales bacterium]|nr:MFS transporter [Burkholderiales bacterium]